MLSSCILLAAWQSLHLLRPFQQKDLCTFNSAGHDLFEVVANWLLSRHHISFTMWDVDTEEHLDGVLVDPIFGIKILKGSKG